MKIINRFMNLSDNALIVLNVIISNVIMSVMIFLRGVMIQKPYKFIGLTYFKVANNADISVGGNCVFRSSKNSNFIGVDRPCLISALLPNAKISIGKNCGFSGTVIGAFKCIEIADDVRVGSNCLITDSDWHLEDERVGPPKKISIGRNVWLGENVTVLKGVTIGENTIIGAKSVVVKDVPANVVACGNPCKIIRKINI